MAWAAQKNADQLAVGDVLGDDRTVEAVTPVDADFVDVTIDGQTTRFRRNFRFALEDRATWERVVIRRLLQIDLVRNVRNQTLLTIQDVRNEYGVTD